MDPNVKIAIGRLVADLVAGNYGQVVHDGRSGRLSEGEIRRAISDYGKTLTLTPSEAWRHLEVIERVGNPRLLAVDIPLWTLEEGRSDLILSVTIATSSDPATIEIDDIRVQ